MHLLLVLTFLIKYSNSIENSLFRVQPQTVSINNDDGHYITSTDHFIGQILYPQDEVGLACECQSQLEDINYNLYWTINDKYYEQYNNSNNIQLIIDIAKIPTSITNVTCHCMFIQSDRTKLTVDYQYTLIIDFDGEPSLKSFNYSVEHVLKKQQLYRFIHDRFIVIISFIAIVIGITCILMILSIVFPQ